MITEHDGGYVDLNVMIKVTVYVGQMHFFCVYLSTFWIWPKTNPLKNTNLHIYWAAPGSLRQSQNFRRLSRYSPFLRPSNRAKPWYKIPNKSIHKLTQSGNIPAELGCFVLEIFFFFLGWKNQTVGWFCAPSALTSAARHATVAFPFPYEKESALGCKKRINPLCSRLEYPWHRPKLLCVFREDMTIGSGITNFSDFITSEMVKDI